MTRSPARLLLALVAGTLLLAGCATAQQQPPAPGNDIGTQLDAPVSPSITHLQLTDSAGHRTSLARYAGKVLVVSDSMTLCQETCPLDTTNIVSAARAVERAGLSDKVQFLTITVDPQRDTPHRLAVYRSLYAGPQQLHDWDLLTGDQATVSRLWKYFGVYSRKVPQSQPPPKDWLTGRPLTYDVQHSDEVFFLDGSQHERFLISGMGHVESAAMVPQRLRGFLNTRGHHNLTHGGRMAWTVPQVLQTVSWLAGHRINPPAEMAAGGSGSMAGVSGSTHHGSGSQQSSGTSMGGMGGAMGGMSMPPAPLTAHTALTTWHLNLWWDLVIVLLGAAYLWGMAMARRHGRPQPWYRALSFYLGLAVLAVTLNSCIEAYGHVLFWMHMVQHLLLIMVIPALIVLASPLSLLVAATPDHSVGKVRSVLTGRAVSVLTHPIAGLALYTAIIVGTHLTSFMQAMLTHMWVHEAEHVLYLVGGFIFLLPLLGDEPIRWRLPYLARIALLFLAMAPDTVVGIVLMQTHDEPFPAYADMHRTWGPSLVHDIQSGGGIMWVFGDGLMMLFIVCVVWAYLTHRERNATAGRWLEGVRRATLADELDHTGGRPIEQTADLDDDEAALASYNAMLARLSDRSAQSTGQSRRD